MRSIRALLKKPVSDVTPPTSRRSSSANGTAAPPPRPPRSAICSSECSSMRWPTVSLPSILPSPFQCASSPSHDPGQGHFHPERLRIYLQTLYQSNIRRQFKLALHQILLTLVRKSELIFARWEHVDFDTAEWQIPAENSKTRAPHIVYLSRQSVEIFRELQELAGGSPWVIPSRSSLAKPFCTTALNQALQGVSFAIPPFTIHDMRRTGSTLLHEKGFPSDVIEKALNHTIGGVRGIYNRAQYSDQRRKMLQFWADYVEGLASEKKILHGNFGRVS